MNDDPIHMKVAQSEGGQFEDDALIAGYVLGALDTYLTYSDFAFDFVIPDGCAEQADLFAMRHNFTSELIHQPGDNGWAVMRFMPSADLMEITT